MNPACRLGRLDILVRSGPVRARVGYQSKDGTVIPASSSLSFRRCLAAGALSLGLVLSGCAGQTGAAEGTGSPDTPAVSLAQAREITGVFDGGAGAAALAASAAFFTSSPAAVILAAPPSDPAAASAEPSAPEAAAFGQASAAAAGLGVPLLVAEPGLEDQISAELDRLGTGAVILYGDPNGGWPASVGKRTRVPGPEDAESFRDALGLDALPAAAEPLVTQIAAMNRGTGLAVPGLDVPAPQGSEPATEPAPEPAGSEPAAQPASPDKTPVGRDAAEELPEFSAAEEESGAVVLATEDPASAAAVATARAAGAEVRMVDTADPRADAEVIEVLRNHREGGIYAAGDAFGGEENFTAQSDVALNASELPGGGQTVFPGRRMVALYGHPSGGSLGVLGEQGMAETLQRAKETAAQYQPHSEEPVIPALEIITTVASSEAGGDGDFSDETAVADLLPWIEAAEAAGVYVVLDLQPGYSTFLEQAIRYEELLKYPHVGLALDAEWRLAPGQRHLEQIGSVDAAEVNETAAWLAGLTRENVLPQKLFMLHQFSLSMIHNRDQLDVSHGELAVSLHADGHGTPGEKLDTWNVLRAGLQPEIWPGWKNFYDEDTPMLTPEQTYGQVEPKPWFISYQ
ncbi:hypothetical protein OL239_09675 [Arthrobacter sp. ATA002]|uniref:hypothetical protein n=1 Tax=Arthrobacter sp. ATA002 TaxID=2991715 RepID=UPI0022A66638|nr:hypothetical protein [Arthrobacter sp. ATA002]WAP50369.1 hypothetical protein OL239_09675 [Arthrobacter sp. ATA002]